MTTLGFAMEMREGTCPRLEVKLGRKSILK